MQEIEAMDISDFSLPTKKRRYKIFTRTSRDISNYDAWRCFDRSFLPSIQDFSKVLPQGKVKYPPSLIKQVFGSPKESIYLCNNVSSVLEFQDSYLDTFVVYQYRQTTVYHGLNREPEYYEYLRKRKGPGTRMRKRPWPTPSEFWQIEEPKQFRIHGPRHCAIYKFKAWFHSQIKNYLEKKEQAEKKGEKILTKDQQILQKFSTEQENYQMEAQKVGEFQDYDKHYPQLQEREVNPLIFRMDYRYWMTPEEEKDLRPQQMPLQFKEPALLDFDIAERVYFTQEDLDKQRAEEEGEEQVYTG